VPKDDHNPYLPPEAGLVVRRASGRYKPIITVARVIVALWGLFILAGPARSAPLIPSRAAEIVFKALGALLFLVAVFPFGNPRGKKIEGLAEPTEDL
jgi:hypothetical protein